MCHTVFWNVLKVKKNENLYSWIQSEKIKIPNWKEKLYKMHENCMYVWNVWLYVYIKKQIHTCNKRNIIYNL